MKNPKIAPPCHDHGREKDTGDDLSDAHRLAFESKRLESAGQVVHIQRAPPILGVSMPAWNATAVPPQSDPVQRAWQPVSQSSGIRAEQIAV